MTREWSVPCVYCGNKVWTITPVCRRRRCRAAEDRYKIRTAARVASPPMGDSRGEGAARTRPSPTSLGSRERVVPVNAAVPGPRALP